MKVILLKDIRGLGKKMDVKEVAEGYARNFLLFKKLALLATAENMAKREQLIKQDQAILNQIKLMAEKLTEEKLELKVKTGERGEIFGSITKDDVKGLLIEKGYRDFQIELEKPIRILGSHQLWITFKFGIKNYVTINIT